jgi:hypothetical protein
MDQVEFEDTLTKREQRIITKIIHEQRRPVESGSRPAARSLFEATLASVDDKQLLCIEQTRAPTPSDRCSWMCEVRDTLRIVYARHSVGMLHVCWQRRVQVLYSQTPPPRVILCKYHGFII